MKNQISAKIVADSINQQGDRITTMEVVFPRMILAEFNTHRLFSRNSASSRAIPFKKMVEMVKTNPFIPIAWQTDHSGMQGTEYITDVDHLRITIEDWLKARDAAVEAAEKLNSGFEDELSDNEVRIDKVTKQLCNRLLEPFMYHKVLVTFTESENFFNLRCPQYVDASGAIYKSKKDYHTAWGYVTDHFKDIDWLKKNKGQGEIHIMDLAEKMWDAMNENTPIKLEPGQWHIPYGDNINLPPTIPIEEGFTLEEGVQIRKAKIAIARCARLSYQTLGDNPKIDYEADLKLFDILKNSGHFSPFEHVAKCMSDEEYHDFYKGKRERDYMLGISSSNPVSHFDKASTGWCGNFKGFIQYRYLLES